MPGQEKTEAPTPRRREETRKKGQVARSQDISAVSGLLAGLLFIRSFGPSLFERLADVMRYSFENAGRIDITPSGVAAQSVSLLTLYLSTVGPLLLGLLVIGLLVNTIQVGFLFTARALMPDVSRLNPLNGFKRMFSLRSLVELVKSMVKVGLSGYIAFELVRGRYEAIVNTPEMELREGLRELSGLASEVTLNMAIILLGVAILDYAYQRWHFEQSIRMTREEVREEMKQMEGSPQLKMRIRQQQRLLAMRRMMQAVPQADVVITNPVHLAIAIQYSSASMLAPRVVAKGQELIAERIKALAREHGVPVVENKPLAQALYRSVDIGQYISPDLYQAVAEVLAFVYRLKRQPAVRSTPVPSTSL